MPTWFYWFLVALLLVTGGLLLLINLWQRHKRRMRLSLELTNAGNVPAAYELHAACPGVDLQFSFSLAGRRLAEQEILLPGSEIYPAAGGGAARPAAPPAGKGQGIGFLKRLLFDGVSAVVNIVSLAAMLLPSSVATPLRQWAQKMRQAQTKGMYAARLQDEVSNLGARAQAASQTRSAAVPHAAGAVQREAWAQTPELQPGGVLVVDVEVQAPHKPQSNPLPLVISSRPAGQSVEPLSEATTLQLPLNSWLVRYGPYLVVLAMALVALVGAWRLATLPILGG